MGGLVNERLKKDAFDERASTVYLSRNIYYCFNDVENGTFYS